jgi:hypothetical protein
MGGLGRAGGRNHSAKRERVCRNHVERVSRAEIRPDRSDRVGADLIGPYARFDPDKIHNSLTAGSLRGPGKLAVPPIVFSKDDESEAIGELLGSSTSYRLCV